MLVLALCFSLIACGGGSTSSGGGSGATGGGDVYSAVWKYTHTDSDQRTNHAAGLLLADYIAANTDGNVTVELYPNAVLGDDFELIKGLQLGTVELYTGSAANFGGNFGEKCDILDLPYIYDGYDNWVYGLDRPGGGGEIYGKILADNGITLLGLMYDGSRSVSNNIRPINVLADMKGIKVRVMNTKVYLSMHQAMGANPTPMSFGEVYTGLAQGTVEGHDCPPCMTVDKKFYEVTKYYSLTEHTMSPAPFAVSTSWLESLPADIRSIFEAGSEMILAWQRAEEHSLEVDFLKEINDNGCIVNEVPSKEPFKQAVKPVYDDWRDAVGADIVDALIASGQ